MASHRLITLASFFAIVCAIVFAECSAQQELLHLPGSGSSQYGRAIAGGGDLNGDGVPDIFIGDSLTTGSTSGLAEARSGADGSLLFSVAGTNLSSSLGWDVDFAGDINADGVVDLVIGERAVTTVGSAYAYSGLDGSMITTVSGFVVGSFFAWSVAGVGDTDADGHDDLLVGAPNELSGGAAHVFSGSNSSLLHSFHGSSSGEFGTAVSRAGDVNGDGHADLFVGNPGVDLIGPNSGSAIVFSGVTGNPLHVFKGPALSNFGESLDFANDVDGDGVGDLTVGAPDQRSMGDALGAIYVFSGATGAELFSDLGDGNFDDFGYSVAGAGDIDGDGLADVIAGTRFANYARVFRGYDGAVLFTLPEAGPTGGWYGFGVAGIGDIDGDGLSDYAVSAPTGGQNGGVRVYSGACAYAPLSFGAGCTGTAAIAPEISVSGCPVPTGTVTLTIANGLGGAPAFLALGKDQAATPIGGGCTLNVSPLIALLGPFGLAGGGPGTGTLSIPGNIPATAATGDFTLQALIMDAGAPTGFSATNGIELTIP